MIKLLVFDVDGTLSDGKVYYSQSGEEIKSSYNSSLFSNRIAKVPSDIAWQYCGVSI